MAKYKYATARIGREPISVMGSVNDGCRSTVDASHALAARSTDGGYGAPGPPAQPFETPAHVKHNVRPCAVGAVPSKSVPMRSTLAGVRSSSEAGGVAGPLKKRRTTQRYAFPKDC